MKNVTISVIIKNIGIEEYVTEYQVLGTYNSKQETLEFVEAPYEDEEQQPAKLIFTKDQNGVNLQRENDEYRMNMVFNPDDISKGDYYFQDLDMHLSLEVLTDTLNYDLTNGIIEIKYYLKIQGEDQGLFEIKINF